MMKWILQDRNFALGNFVNITPIIKHLYLETAKPVPVYFETEYVRQAYEGCHMIDILERRPEDYPFASSAMICRNNSTEDYKYAFKLVTGEEWTPMFKPFAHYQHRAVIINGSGSQRTDYVASKDPGIEPYEFAISLLQHKGYHVEFVGSNDDYLRNTTAADKCNGILLDNMPAAIDAVRQADIIIANDTGLAHIAGTFNKRMLVIWKDTPTVRVRNSGARSVYSYNGSWIQDIKSFINTYAK